MASIYVNFMVTLLPAKAFNNATNRTMFATTATAAITTALTVTVITALVAPCFVC